MINKDVTQYFDKVFEAIEAYQKAQNSTYHGAALMVLKDINAGEATAIDQEDVKQKIQAAVDLDWQKLDFSARRHVLQLILLKIDRMDKVEPNLQLTPDGIGYLLGDLIYQTADWTGQGSLLDLTVGTGNLLWTVEEVLLSHKLDPDRYGFDNSDEQLALATVSDDLLNEKPSDFYQADVLTVPKDEIPAADVVLADLPVGYYPGQPDGDYMTASAEANKSFAHYVMIEKAFDLVQPKGWLYFIVPANLLDGEESQKMLKFITNRARLKAFMRLPADYFKNAAAAKAVLVLQPKEASQQGEVLMGQYPSLKDPKGFEEFLQEIKRWVKLEKE
ncbi:class I SAM-dependent methyltransferase [Eupransor demetentiae]|uniref:Adenine-specific DNA N6-methylase (YtxK) n=1 Tax=Eupransor demetentiae TaxID=3109584 RepID=A0ABM9N2Y9_9LACO|nr:Adenine-specific DNA N6-methylase (YtxK) [Lactobacillaceae bacterium LMG 33000]